MALPPHLADLEQRLASRLAEAVAEFRRSAEARLRRESERWLSALAELPAPATSGWIAERDLAALDLVPRDEARRATLDRLGSTLRALDVARGQAEALDALLDGAHGWAARVALVLARDSGLSVWGDRGFGESSLAGRELDWDATLRERLLASRGCLRLDADSAAEVLEPFGAVAAGSAVVVPLVLRDRIAALLWADGPSEREPELGALQILAHAAGQRLELQALSERACTPTLWEGASAPGAPLPLWSVLSPAAEVPVEEVGVETAERFEPAAEEEALQAAEESGSALWQVAPAEAEAGEAAVAEAPAVLEEGPELAAAATGFDEIPEGAGGAGEVMPPEPLLAAEPEAMPAFELESAPPEAAEEEEAARWEPAPEQPADELWGAPPAPPAETSELPQLPDLGTVRMPVPALESWSRPAEEATAPLPIAPPPPAIAVETHEVELPPAEAPAPAAEADRSEEATMLSLPRPSLPASPPVASTVAVEPPTWSLSPPAPAAPPEDPMERTGSRFGRSTEVAPPPDVSGPGLAFLSGRAGRSAIDPSHEEAKRLARLLISEIRLYNEEQVLEGRRNRDLYHRLKDDIDRSRQIFDERVDPTVRASVDYFQQELVRSLAGGDPRALGI